MNTKIIERRSRITKIIREYLDSRGFIEIFSPKLLEILTDPVRGKKNEGINVSYSSKKGFLAQSNQNFKQQAIISGLNKVYEIAHYWRDNREGITLRHNYEFICLDVELRNIFSESELMDILSEMINLVIKKDEGLENIEKIIWPIPRITYDYALNVLNKNSINIESGEDIGFIREKKLGEILKKTHGDLFFIYKYPASVKKFYTKRYPDLKYTKTFDLIYCGWEICSGAVRETDKKRIIEGMNELGLDLEKYKFYTDLFNGEAPAHGGFGFGLDRFIALLSGYKSVGEFDDDCWRK